MAAWPIPSAGDIVWCLFPELPKRGPGPKPRPALVCDVEEREDGVVVTVAYGTSQGLNKLHAGEFAITRQGQRAAFQTAGLSYDTKFNVRERVELPWTEQFFSVAPGAPCGQQPKMGTLHASMYRAASAAHEAVKDD